MTYERLFELKFKKRISTYELVRRYPRHIKEVSEVALLDVPEETLLQIVQEEKVLKKVKALKRKFLRGR